MRVLVVTRLYPNAVEPNAAAFNRQQIEALARQCDLELLAVIPWFPGARAFARWSAAGRLVAVPACERVGALDVRHPRALYLPRVHALAPALYAASLWPHVRDLRGRVDVVLGSWAFPDGVAAVTLGRRLGAPAVVKIHGSDLNVIALQRSAGTLLRRALPRAARVVAVSRGLAERARALGVAAERIAIVPNGVDRALFSPRDRDEARARLRAAGGGFPDGARGLLYVGRLEAAKGIAELLDAFARLAPTRPELCLALVGDGAQRALCRQAAEAWPGRVIVAGSRPLPEVATWVTACDALALPSWNEGTPNVVLEALAAGRPVVATAVGGIPDVIDAPELGELVPPRDAAALAGALGRVLEARHDPERIAASAPGSWDDSATRLRQVLAEAAREPGRAAPAEAA